MGNKKIFCNITIILLLLLLSYSINSQNLSTNIEKGKSYKFVLFDNTEITGKVIGIDSLSVSVFTNDKRTFTFPKNSILYYTTDLTPSTYKYSFSLLGGISAVTGGDYLYSYNGDYNKTKVGPNFNAGATFFLSDSKAIKIDAAYTYLKPTYNDQPYPVSGYPTQYEGGDLSMFSLKGNLMLGSFEPKSRLMYYFSVGAGIHYSHWKEYKYAYYYQPYPDSNIIVKESYTYPSQSSTNLLISLGAGLGYRFSKRFGCMMELEYDMTTYNSFFIFWGSGYFPIRAGVYYIF